MVSAPLAPWVGIFVSIFYLHPRGLDLHVARISFCQGNIDKCHWVPGCLPNGMAADARIINLSDLFVVFPVLITFMFNVLA